jgi:ABC-type sugar transport system substrate-binding protein
MSHRNTRRRGVVTVAVSLVVLAASACSSSSGKATGSQCAKTYTIGFSNANGQAGFVKALKKRAQAIADQQGCVKLLLDSTTNSELQGQRATLESWVTQKIDAIVVLPVDAAALASVQKQAQTAGIKWLTYAFKGAGVDGSTGFDSTASGQAAADYLDKWVKANIPDPSSVTAMVTKLTPVEAVAGGRWKVPLQKLAALGIKVVSDQDCADPTCGLQITEDTLRAHSNLRIFVGLNDDAALGAAKAFTNAKIDPAKVLVIGQDGNPEALQAIKAGGPMKASIGINLEELAQAIVHNPLNAIQGKTPVDSQAGVVVASVDDPAGLDALIASYNK